MATNGPDEGTGHSEPAAAPFLSVVIPAYNEERALPATLERLFREQGDYEVIVVDGGSTDRTREIMAEDRRIRLLRAPKGRASQMNAGAGAALGRWLLFLHADTLLPEGAICRIVDLASDGRVRAGGFRHRFSGNHWGLGLVSWLDNTRCWLTHVVYGDQALFIERALFESLGGFPDTPMMEDLIFGERLNRVTRPALLREYVVTDSRKFEQMGVFRSLGRVLLILLCHHLRLPTPARAFFKDVR
jgi:rSAM/selenodomain-associated transferase 2